MHKAIDESLAHLIPLLAQEGIVITAQREISYGVQLKLLKCFDVSVLNIYHSAKKGLSYVIGGDKNNALRARLKELLSSQMPSPEPQAGMHSWQTWCGSDECGKGDYFGALVVAGMTVVADDLPKLRRMGVQDSKNLRDQQIVNIAKQLYESYSSRIACIVLKPIKYNEIYADMKKRGQNLNDLLAWQHGKVIMDLYGRELKPEGALVDQFSKSAKVRALLKVKLPLLPVVERPGAEADAAVAAASIIARYQFLQSQASLSRYYQIEFPLGSGSGIITTGKQFIAKYGFPRLCEVAKLHFVTTAKLEQKTII